MSRVGQEEKLSIRVAVCCDSANKDDLLICLCVCCKSAIRKAMLICLFVCVCVLRVGQEEGIVDFFGRLCECRESDKKRSWSAAIWDELLICLCVCVCVL